MKREQPTNSVQAHLFNDMEIYMQLSINSSAVLEYGLMKVWSVSISFSSDVLGYGPTETNVTTFSISGLLSSMQNIHPHRDNENVINCWWLLFVPKWFVSKHRMHSIFQLFYEKLNCSSFILVSFLCTIFILKLILDQKRKTFIKSLKI